MKNEEFDITMYPFKGRHNKVKFHVEITYLSAQVERYKLTAGHKVMELEKRLILKTNQWRILSTNFVIDNVDNATARNLQMVFNWIDYIRTGKGADTYRPPEQRTSK